MDNHSLYRMALRDKGRLPVIVTGRAGTGKTYGALDAAVEGLIDHKYQHIICTRPNISYGEDIGFLPGTEREKMEPWIRPIMQNLAALGISDSLIRDWERHGKLLFIPVPYLQGLTFDSSFIIADEGENMTFKQLNGLATRQGKYSKLVICGDIYQTSEQFKSSGLGELVSMVKHAKQPVHLIEFERGDDMRSDACASWCDMLEDWEEMKEKKAVEEVPGVTVTTFDGSIIDVRNLHGDLLGSLVIEEDSITVTYDCSEHSKERQLVDNMADHFCNLKGIGDEQ